MRDGDIPQPAQAEYMASGALAGGHHVPDFDEWATAVNRLIDRLAEADDDEAHEPGIAGSNSCVRGFMLSGEI